MYCMPQVGTKAALYLGSGNEAQGVVSGCIRMNGASCEGTGSPEKKGFCSEHGKGMSLYPQSMGMDGGESGKITMEDGRGTLLESGGGLLLLAKEGIRLEIMTGIAVQGVSDIMALCGAGTSSLCVNGSVDMTGGLTGLGGSTYRNYAPYADAPEEGEFDWGGFARNLVMGLAVGAACIAMSLLLPGIGTIAAGALMGAGIGAVSASVAGAAGDYSSGNVRSTEEAIRDVAIAAISGAITGAVGVKFPGMNRLVEGSVDTTVATVERAAYAALDGDMTLEEKLAYIFDPGQMAVDFVTGVVIGEAVDGIGNKLPSGWFKGQGGSRALDNIDEVRYRIGQPVCPVDKTLEHYLNPEGYAYEIAKRYGINLKGSGEKITIKYNPDLASAGKSRKATPTVIELGNQAFLSEEELANTIAHELNHARDWLKGGDAPDWPTGTHPGAYASGDALAEYIKGER